MTWKRMWEWEVTLYEYGVDERPVVTVVQAMWVHEALSLAVQHLESTGWTVLSSETDYDGFSIGYIEARQTSDGAVKSFIVRHKHD